MTDPARIRALRTALGLTQRQFGALIGHPFAANVAQIEAGTRPVSPTLARLLDALADGWRPTL